MTEDEKENEMKKTIKCTDIFEGIKKFTELVKVEIEKLPFDKKGLPEEQLEKVLGKIKDDIDIINKSTDDIEQIYHASTHSEIHLKYAISDRYNMVDVLADLSKKFDRQIEEDLIDFVREDMPIEEKIATIGIFLNQYADFMKNMSKCICSLYASKIALVELDEEDNGIKPGNS